MEYEEFIATGRFLGQLYELIDDYDDEIAKEEMAALFKELACKLERVKPKKKDDDEDDDN